MAKTKRKINKQSVMQKQQWKYMRRRYPFLVPVRHWYTGMKMTKKEIKNTPPILSLESRDIPAVCWDVTCSVPALLFCISSYLTLSFCMSSICSSPVLLRDRNTIVNITITAATTHIDITFLLLNIPFSILLHLPCNMNLYGNYLQNVIFYTFHFTIYYNLKLSGSK